VGYSGDRRRPGAFVTPISRAAAARSRGGVRAGATRNRRWESDPTPFWGVTRGRPCRPPNAQRPAAASPALHLAQRRAYHRGAHERGFRTLYRSRSKVASSPVNAPGVALPHAQRPTPKRPQRPTPNAQRPRDPNAQRQSRKPLRMEYRAALSVLRAPSDAVRRPARRETSPSTSVNVPGRAPSLASNPWPRHDRG
jgi:hypothetical protein